MKVAALALVWMMVRWHAPAAMAAAEIAAPAAAEETRPGINAANVYGPVFSGLAAWTAAHPGFGSAPDDPTSPEAARAYAELQPHLAALKPAEQADYCDWGTRYEDGAMATLPHVQPARQAAKAANWAAAYAAARRLPAFADHALSAMGIARNVGEDGLLIDLLVQIACETAPTDLLLRNIDQLDARQLDALATALKNLPPGANTVDAMEMERAVFVDTLIKNVRKAMDAADPEVFETVRSNAPSWLADNLRLCSIVGTGDGCWIGFETREGVNFTLSLGHPRHGMELLSVDHDRGEAIIARSNETALVKLKAREIVPFRLRLHLSTNMPPHHPLAQLAAAFNPGGDGGAGWENLMRETGGTAEGLLRILEVVRREHVEVVDALRRMPPDEFPAWQDRFMERACALTRLIVPAVAKVAEKERGMLDARTKLAAALAARRTALSK